MTSDNLVLYYVKEPIVTKDDIRDLHKDCNGQVCPPPTAYRIFCRKNQYLISRQQPGNLTYRLIGMIWKNLPPAIKDMYYYCELQLKMIHSQLFPFFEADRRNKRKRGKIQTNELPYAWLYLNPTNEENCVSDTVAAKRARLYGQLDAFSTTTLPPDPLSDTSSDDASQRICGIVNEKGEDSMASEAQNTKSSFGRVVLKGLDENSKMSNPNTTTFTSPYEEKTLDIKPVLSPYQKALQENISRRVHSEDSSNGQNTYLILGTASCYDNALIETYADVSHLINPMNHALLNTNGERSPSSDGSSNILQTCTMSTASSPVVNGVVKAEIMLPQACSHQAPLQSSTDYSPNFSPKYTTLTTRPYDDSDTGGSPVSLWHKATQQDFNENSSSLYMSTNGDSPNRHGINLATQNIQQANLKSPLDKREVSTGRISPFTGLVMTPSHSTVAHMGLNTPLHTPKPSITLTPSTPVCEYQFWLPIESFDPEEFLSLCELSCCNSDDNTTVEGAQDSCTGDQRGSEEKTENLSTDVQAGYMEEKKVVLDV